MHLSQHYKYPFCFLYFLVITQFVPDEAVRPKQLPYSIIV